ncbi:hypothetical protein ACFQ3F_14870 [Nocardioides ginsengisoli]|uniref:Transcriptional regulator, AbiEi antitoxin, Type IV TA system n=1 Tax=Nocardioides ginsengisoli TaxID=363868 RepID=A0ABW3W4C0_9ACTN
MELGHDDPRLAAIRLRRELLDSGAHSDQSLARAVQLGWLARPRRGAYVDGPLWRSLSPDQQYALRCRAAFRQAHTGVILSHVSALPFHDAPVWGFDLDDVHLTRVDGRSGRREAGIRRHCGQLMSGDVVELHDVDVMSALRATLEASLVGSVEASLVVVNHFLHRGEYDLPTLAARYEASMDRWPSSLTTDLVLRLADARHESVGETRMAYFFFARSLPKPIPQFEVYDGSTLVARLDFALPELGVWMEFDGRVKYERFLRTGESPADAVVREKRREETVAELTGWRCLRVTWDDLADPPRLERRVRDLIASVSRSRRAAG